MKIQFVIPKSNLGWAYPLIKWNKNFKDKGIQVEVISKPEYNSSKKADLIILTSRYYRSFYKTNPEYLQKYENELKKDIELLKDDNTKIIFYDLSAPTGSRELKIVKTVDLFLKRQIFKDKSRYTKKHAFRPWVDDGHLFDGCDVDQLDKIQLGWNLAYQDYAEWPFINPNKFGLNIVKNPIYTTPNKNRKLTATFRGKDSQKKPQRVALLQTLNELSRQKPNSFISGEFIKKSMFIKEMRNTKTTISPFGWGEICYRDMEAFINGCILIKPTMDHSHNFPNVFLENKTYIPVKWDLSDLMAVLQKIDDNYSDYMNIASEGQNVFKDAYEDFYLFFDHFQGIIDKVYSTNPKKWHS